VWVASRRYTWKKEDDMQEHEEQQQLEGVIPEITRGKRTNDTNEESLRLTVVRLLPK
jgi:hypothetical protein